MDCVGRGHRRQESRGYVCPDGDSATGVGGSEDAGVAIRADAYLLDRFEIDGGVPELPADVSKGGVATAVRSAPATTGCRRVV